MACTFCNDDNCIADHIEPEDFCECDCTCKKEFCECECDCPWMDGE